MAIRCSGLTFGASGCLRHPAPQTPIVFARSLLVAALASLAGCSEPVSLAPSEELLEGRAFHSATLLDDGTVLFAGGKGKTFLSSAELRDTVTGRWSHAANLNAPRAEHSATRIDDGRVILAGGRNETNEILDTAEIYENGAFQILPRMNQKRIGHTATWVDVVGSDKRRLMVAGGEDSTGSSKNIELYDAAPMIDAWSTQMWEMIEPRAAHTATPLKDGTIVIIGGRKGNTPSNTAETCSVATNMNDQTVGVTCNLIKCVKDKKPIECMPDARSEHTATRLDADLILIVGGKGSNGILRSAMIYNAATHQSAANQFLEVGPLHEARYGHTATRLVDGSVLVTGGMGANGPLDSVERFDITTNQFEVVSPMSAPRVGHTATWLANGSVVIAGGDADAASSVDRFVVNDLRLACKGTEDCSIGLVCNKDEQRCENPSTPLESQSACSMGTDAAPGGARLGFVGIALAMAALRRRSWRKKNVVIVLGFGGVLLVPEVAQAQSSTFYLDRLQIAGGPNDGTAVWRPVFGPTRLFGQLGVDYALNPLRVETVGRDSVRARGISDSAVRVQLTGHLTVGVEMAKRGAIQVSVPYIAVQRSYPAEIGLVGVASRALGDTRIDGRMLMVWNESRTFQLAVRGSFFLPTGDETSFAGERGAWAQIGLSGEYDAGAFFLTGNAGMSVRPRSRLIDLTVGSEFVYALGVYVPLVTNRVRLGAEMFGSVGLLSKTAASEQPLEAALTTRVGLGVMQKVFLGASAGGRLGSGYAPDMRFVARIGGVLSFDRAVVKPPRLPVLPPIEWVEPVEEGDEDHDGFVDSKDACPGKPEDHNGKEDGCPEAVLDRDGDGIVDALDKCPDEAENINGVDDKDGCPEKDRDGDGIVDPVDDCPNEVGVAAAHRFNGCPAIPDIAKEIKFDGPGSSTIAKESYTILDIVAKMLEANLAIKLRIEGHTDAHGIAAVNKELSQKRADAVRKYLVDKGIDPKRLNAVGKGSEKLLDKGNSIEADQTNRRVELNIE